MRRREALAALLLAATLIPTPTAPESSKSRIPQQPSRSLSEPVSAEEGVPRLALAASRILGSRPTRAAPALRFSGWASASWYDERPGFCDGQPVPAGIRLWAAHAAPYGVPLPCGTRMELTTSTGGRVEVVVADRGPCRGWSYRPKRCTQPIYDSGFGLWRHFDLSRAAFIALTGSTRAGIAAVHWRIL